MSSASHPTTGLINALAARETALAVVGMGYVGVPLAACMARRYRVIGYDIHAERIANLEAGHDHTGDVGDAVLASRAISFTTDAARLSEARAILVAVPTPVDQANVPDLSALRAASRSIGRHLRPGTVVIYESTVHPGATEEVCVPILAAESGLRPGIDFAYGFSPERINPGDHEHTIERIRKIVSGNDAISLECVAALYGAVIDAGVYLAPSVKVAEAAKVMENTQRDLNVALMNELALICHRLDIDTADVLDAAGSKWNFVRFRPGLVGGHCIGVDPYYLTHKAQEVGYHPAVILAGRRINDEMGRFVAQECVRLMIDAGRQVKGATVLVLGITFKEDCGDVRNSKVVDIVRELERFGAKPVVVDPVADAAACTHEYGIVPTTLDQVQAAEAVILAVAHTAFRRLDLGELRQRLGAGGPVLDVKSTLDRAAVVANGLRLWRL